MGSKRLAPRPDLGFLTGYHSPQTNAAVRLNTNESPLPPPPGFIDALAVGVRDLSLNRYPERSVFRLRDRLAERHGIDATQVFAANGSNEVIQTILLAYGGANRTVAVFQPTYAMHSQVARTTGSRLLRGRREKDFSLNVSKMSALLQSERPEVVFLCSPNNPTGNTDPEEILAAGLDAVSAYGGLIVVDEAYGEFAGITALSQIGEGRPLLVSRTFSKTWAMAGIRLGYVVGPSWCLAELEKVVLPYHLNAISQLAGLLALDYEVEMSVRVATLVEERERLTECLRKLEVVVWPSAANFVLFRPETRTGTEVWNGLLERSVLVRDCSSWEGLDDCLRVTVGTADENDHFLTAIGEVLT